MKKLIVIFLALFIKSGFVAAQVNSNIKLESNLIPADTIISKDHSIPGKEYWVIRTKKGITTSQGAFVNGFKDGVWREYSKGNGIVSKLEEYKMGRKNGAWLTFSQLGQVSIDETFVNDTLQGQRTLYRNNSRVQSFEYYKDGLLSGLKTSFYEDTKLQEEALYDKGLRHGLSKWYLNSGIPSLEYTYVHGTLQGPSKEYDENGKVKREGNYLNNEQEGEWKVYENEILVKKIMYKAGQVVKEINVKSN